MKNIDTYQQGCLQTESHPEVLIENGKQAVALTLVLHEIVKIGEQADKVKKHLFYKRPEPSIDKHPNIRDEDWTEVRGLSPQIIRILHCILGVQSELEELTKPVIDHILNGTPLDDINVMEELGDIAWYLSIGLDAAGFSFSETLHRNRMKLLEKRYKKGYSNEAAKDRDLDSERTALETAKVTANSECLLVAELLAHESLDRILINKTGSHANPGPHLQVCLSGGTDFIIEPAEGSNKTLTDALADLHSRLSRAT